MPEIPSVSLTGHQYLWLYLFTGCGAFVLARLLTPLVRKFAIRQGVIDRPDRRKIHQDAVARWGGMALFLSFFLVMAALLLFSGKFRRLLSYNDFLIAKEFAGIFAGSLVISALGMYDDFKPLPPKVKLLVQFLVVGILIAFGIKITGFTNPLTGSSTDLGGFASFGLTLLWVVAILNAFNFIDGMDGSAAGISFIGSATFFLCSLILKTHASDSSMSSLTFTAILSCALAGSSLGFLKYNFPPASIFMGDGGSLFLGYILASLALIGTFKTTATVSLFIPLLALAIPILDAFWVLWGRFWRGHILN